MKNSMRAIMMAALSIILCPCDGVADSAIDVAQLQDERAKLQFLAAQVRIELIRDDVELQQLHERILSLQKVLIKQLDSKPEMARIRERIAVIDAQLAARSAAVDTTVPADHR